MHDSVGAASWRICVQRAIILTRFEGGTQIWRHRTENFTYIGRLNLDYYSLRLMLEISYAGCIGPCPVISAQFTLKMCVAV